MDKSRIKELVSAVLSAIEDEQDYLNRLDAQLGDGDHGLSMATGLRALLASVEAAPENDLARILSEGGKAFNEAAGSTIGILMMAALRAAGKAADGREARLDQAAAADLLDAAAEGIARRGKSGPGQKTILDTLVPAAAALRAAANGAGAADAVIWAAHEGALSTRDMVSSTGRARWFKQRSVGVQDAGAWSGYLIIKALAESLDEAEEARDDRDQ